MWFPKLQPEQHLFLTVAWQKGNVSLEYSYSSLNLGQTSQGDDGEDWPCHSSQNHSQLTITQFLFAVWCCVSWAVMLGLDLNLLLLHIGCLTMDFSFLLKRLEIVICASPYFVRIKGNPELFYVSYKHILSVQQCSLCSYTHLCLTLNTVVIENIKNSSQLIFMSEHTLF